MNDVDALLKRLADKYGALPSAEPDIFSEEDAAPAAARGQAGFKAYDPKDPLASAPPDDVTDEDFQLGVANTHIPFVGDVTETTPNTESGRKYMAARQGGERVVNSIHRAIPAAVAGAGTASLLAPVASRAIAAAPEALRGLATLAGAAGVGAGSGYVQGATEGLSDPEGGATLRSRLMSAHEAGKDTAKMGAVLGPFAHVVGEGLGAAKAIPGRIARAFEDSPSPMGEHMRALRDAESVPVPIPGKPLLNPPSARIAAEVGPDVKVRATGKGRGRLAAHDVGRMESELEAQKASSSERYKAGMANADQIGESSQPISVDSDIAKIDAALANRRTAMVPGLQDALTNARGVLTGELEPTIDLWPVRNVPQTGSRANAARPAGRRIAVTAPSDYEPGVGGRADMEGEQSIGELARRKEIGNTERQPAAIRADSGPRGQVDYDYSEARGPEPLTVPTADVRGGSYGKRPDAAPNYVMPAGEYNKYRQNLDETLKRVYEGADPKKRDLAISSLATEARKKIEKHAPSIHRANRAFATDESRFNDVGELMKDTNLVEDGVAKKETLATQLASLGGDETSAAVGAREARLLKLMDQFPTSHRFSRADIERILQAPQQLWAEEAQGIQNIPHRASQIMNIKEPLLTRGIYGPAKIASQLQLRQPLETLNPLLLAAEQKKRRDDARAASLRGE